MKEDGKVINTLAELYSYKNIKKYIRVFIDGNKTSQETYEIEHVSIDGYNYQMRAKTNNHDTLIITLSFNTLPPDRSFKIIDNTILKMEVYNTKMNN